MNNIEQTETHVEGNVPRIIMSLPMLIYKTLHFTVSYYIDILCMIYFSIIVFLYNLSLVCALSFRDKINVQKTFYWTFFIITCGSRYKHVKTLNHNEYYTGVWKFMTIFVYQDQQMRQQTVSYSSHWKTYSWYWNYVHNLEYKSYPHVITAEISSNQYNLMKQ